MGKQEQYQPPSAQLQEANRRLLRLQKQVRQQRQQQRPDPSNKRGGQ